MNRYRTERGADVCPRVPYTSVRASHLLLALLLSSNARAQASDTSREVTASIAPAADAPSLSLPTGAPQTGGSVATPPHVAAAAPSSTNEWHFDVSGYLRAPFRFSWGLPTRAVDGGGRGTQLRSPPLVPDANYIDYRYTGNLAGPWSELNFHYGNSLARATIQVASYNLTDAGYRRLEANLGINQAYLTLQPRPFLSGRLQVGLTVGGFSDRYGAAGRYDAGKYDTYLFGRTHVVGETLRVSYVLSDELSLTIEHGFGGKLEPTPFLGAPTGPRDNPSWAPYAGPVAQEATFVHHGHAGLLLFGELLLGAHVIHVFANDNERAGSYQGSAYAGRPVTEATPRLLIWGADLKLTGSDLGDGYLGYCHLDARNADYLGDAVEVLHSFNGWQLHDNFFGSSGATERATGKIDTVLFQHVVRLSALLPKNVELFANGADLSLAAFGLFNAVSGASDASYNVKKLKWGAELMATPLDWLSFGARYDRVSPHLGAANSAFSVISPRLVLQTALVTHEQIALSYHHYFYGSAAASSSYPYNSQVGASALGADRNAAQIAATMWF